MKIQNRTLGAKCLALVAMLGTSSVVAADKADEFELYGLGGGRFEPVPVASVRTARITSSFDLDKDLPTFGNFRREGETNPAGNGFGMAYRTQRHLRDRQGFGPASSTFLSKTKPLGEHHEIEQMLAFEEDQQREHSESQVRPGAAEATTIELIRTIEASASRDEVLTLTSKDGKHRRYLFVYEAREVGAMKIFNFFDPHAQGSTAQTPTRLGVLVSIAGRFFVDEYWDRCAASGGQDRFAGEGAHYSFEARWSDRETKRSPKQVVEVKVDRFGTARTGGGSWWYGFNWVRAAGAANRVLQAGGVATAPARYVEGALNGVRAAISVHHASFDAIDPELVPYP